MDGNTKRVLKPQIFKKTFEIDELITNIDQNTPLFIYRIEQFIKSNNINLLETKLKH